MASFEDLAFDWSTLCQECPECWTASGKDIVKCTFKIVCIGFIVYIVFLLFAVLVTTSNPTGS